MKKEMQKKKKESFVGERKIVYFFYISLENVECVLERIKRKKNLFLTLWIRFILKDEKKKMKLV